MAFLLGFEVCSVSFAGVTGFRIDIGVRVVWGVQGVGVLQFLARVSSVSLVLSFLVVCIRLALPLCTVGVSSLCSYEYLFLFWASRYLPGYCSFMWITVFRPTCCLVWVVWVRLLLSCCDFYFYSTSLLCWYMACTGLFGALRLLGLVVFVLVLASLGLGFRRALTFCFAD